MIERGKYYVTRSTVGKYHVYLALEDAYGFDSLIKVIDLTDDSITFLTSRIVYEVEPGRIDKEYLDVAKRHLAF